MSQAGDIMARLTRVHTMPRHLAESAPSPAGAKVLGASGGSGPFTHKYLISGLVDHLTADYRHRHTHIAKPLDRHPAEFLGRHEKIGRLADLPTALELYFKRREGVIDRVHADGNGQVHDLIGATDVPGHRPLCQRLRSVRESSIRM
jgi:hypothetical protein